MGRQVVWYKGTMNYTLRCFQFLIISSLLMLGFFFVVSIPTQAQSLNDTACDGFQNALGSSGGCGEEGGEQINSTLETVVNILSAIVAIISVIMILIAGIKYVTSGGDAGSINSAKDTIIYAIVGLVIVAVAQFIVNFVLANVTG